MGYCNKCKTNILGKNEACPLCQTLLEENGVTNEEVFPEVHFKKNKVKEISIKILLLILVSAVVFSATVNYILPQTGHWFVYVVGGVISALLILFGGILLKGYILTRILYETVMISVLSLVWDSMTGMYAWSVNFVIPLAILLGTTSIAILVKALKMQTEEYSIYLCDFILLNIIPFFLLVKGITVIKIPSAICLAVNTIIMLIFIIFEGNKILQDIIRRFHI